MPIFDFACNACGEKFEALVLKNSPPTQCPKCEGQDLEQLISLFGVSSESTRAASMKGAKARAAGVRKDYEMAQLAYEKEHRH